ncbi:MAG TPA: alpha-(1-2)-phosphatidylinositol mannosyltransferase, partial [Acidimicrobiales bacterium]|nr:alpha-(1-2)-phosphatidylinositol mannosyltransferase [Acidimicrobiales bacterium]
MTRTLLVTNDYPPKVGGIQTYLGELWRRLDPSTTSVLTASSHPDAAAHDAALREAGLRVERVPASTLYLPTPSA